MGVLIAVLPHSAAAHTINMHSWTGESRSRFGWLAVSLSKMAKQEGKADSKALVLCHSRLRQAARY